MAKRIYLLFASLLIIGLFFAVPRYFSFFYRFILNPPISYADEFRHLAPEDRRWERYGNSYVVYVQGIEMLQKANITDPIILLPPAGYLTKNGCFDVETVEPAEFYYFTGCKAVYASSPGVDQATWTFVPKGKNAMLRRVHNKADLDELVNTYLQFKPNR